MEEKKYYWKGPGEFNGTNPPLKVGDPLPESTSPAQIERLKKLDRLITDEQLKHAAAIVDPGKAYRELKAENKKLQAENERLKTKLEAAKKPEPKGGKK